MHRKLYQIADRLDSRKIAEFLSKDGQLLLPFLELFCNTEQALDEIINVAGKASSSSVLSTNAATFSNCRACKRSYAFNPTS